MPRLKRIGVLFLAKLLASSMGVLGLLAGVLYAFGGFFYELANSDLNSGTALAFLALAGMPIIFAAIGFGAGLACAVIYNLTVGLTGGLESDMDLEQ